MFGWRRPLTALSPLCLLLLIAARATGQPPTTSNASSFSSVIPEDLETVISQADELRERLDALQTVGQIFDTSSNPEETSLLEDLLAFPKEIGDEKITEAQNAKIAKIKLTPDDIDSQKQLLKKYFWKSPFKLIQLFFSDLDSPKAINVNLDEGLFTELSSSMGLKSMFNFILKVFGVESKVGKYILEVSESLSKTHTLFKLSSNRGPFESTGLPESTLPLLAPIEKESRVSEVEEKVKQALIKLMTAASDDVPYSSPKEKLSAVLNCMKDLVTTVEDFLVTLKNETSKEELLHINKEQNTISALHGTPQYPDFYARILKGNLLPIHSEGSTSSLADSELKPSSKREISEFDKVSAAETSQENVNVESDLLTMTNLIPLLDNDTVLANPSDKWNMLRKVFNESENLGNRTHYYNYFVDEGSLLDKIKELTKLLLEREENNLSPRTSLKSFVDAKVAFNLLERLMTDVYGVRKAAIAGDPKGAEEFSEVYYNAEEKLEEVKKVLLFQDFSEKAAKYLDLFSKKLFRFFA